MYRTPPSATGSHTVRMSSARLRRIYNPVQQTVAAPGSLHAWSDPGEQPSVARVELRPGSPGFEKGLRIAYGLAADGLVLKSGVPRSPLHAVLLLDMGGVPPARGLRGAGASPGAAGPPRPAPRPRRRARAPLPLSRPGCVDRDDSWSSSGQGSANPARFIATGLGRERSVEQGGFAIRVELS